MIEDSDGATYIPGYDGMGNVSMLVSAQTGEKVANFVYSAYGDLLLEDDVDNITPFRYQTKWQLNIAIEDPNNFHSDLYDFSQRFYHTEQGRFINKDPIAEEAGNNLYAYVGNDPINQWDYLGYASDDDDFTDEEIKACQADAEASFDAWEAEADAEARSNSMASNMEAQRTLYSGVQLNTLYYDHRQARAGSLSSEISWVQHVTQRTKSKAQENTNAETNNTPLDPNVRNAAIASAAAYDKENPPPGYVVIDERHSDSGLDAVVFKNEDTGHVIVAFAGTTGKFWDEDWKTNFANACGFKTKQFSEAIEFAQNIKKEYGDNVLLTGHSLGGGLASAASLVTGLDGITFNASGLTRGSIRGYKVKFNSKPKSVTAYYVRGDFLSLFQDFTPFRNAAGQRIGVVSRDWNPFRTIIYHNMNLMLKSLGIER